MHRTGTERPGKADAKQVGPSSGAETPGDLPPGEGVSEAERRRRVGGDSAQDAGSLLAEASYTARMLPDEGLKRLDIIEAANVRK